MPSKPFKPCNVIGCHGLTKDKYCDVHKEQEQEDKAIRDKYYDMYARDKKSRKFYTSPEWKHVRQIAKSRVHNLCEHHLKNKEIVFADVCDHIIPIKVDWSKRLDLDNLQMLCHACHNAKTADDKVKYGI